MALSPSGVIKAVCPRCKKGRITAGLMRMQRECPECGLNLYPEPGYYLGAMMAGFMVSAILLIPTIVVLKVSDVQPAQLFIVPILQYLILAPLISFYSRVIWLHLEYSISERWNKKEEERKK